ncbi:AGAP011063-PA-like protein [Anopheles sinensis]|uniref:AGAP011063-PA-like protein n=1 Tax=Anopheles sinensis TaxID=74873 RepID=A0A084WLW4_ANOSI|nr:AGAP011063-PA-like protein [Anopheles sinensis]
MRSTRFRFTLATALVLLVAIGSWSDRQGVTAQLSELDCSDPRNVGIFLPHPSSCQKYLNCWGGLLVEGTCPLGLFFDLERQVCESEARVRCAEPGKEPTLDEEIDED